MSDAGREALAGELLVHQLRQMATEFAIDNKTDLKQRICWVAADRLAALRAAPQLSDALRPFYEWAERNRSAVASEPMDELIRLARIACDQYVKAQAANDSRPWDHIYIGKVKYVRADHGLAQTPCGCQTGDTYEDIKSDLLRRHKDACDYWMALTLIRDLAIKPESSAYKWGAAFALADRALGEKRASQIPSAPQQSPEPATWLDHVRAGLQAIVDLKNPLPRAAVREAVAELLASLPTDPATAAPGQSLRVDREGIATIEAMDRLLAEAADELNVAPRMRAMDIGSKITGFRLLRQKMLAADKPPIPSTNRALKGLNDYHDHHPLTSKDRGAE